MEQPAKKIEGTFPSRQIKGLSGTLNEDCSKWPTPDEGAFTEENQKKYLLRKKAIIAYLAGEPAVSLRQKFGLGVSFLFRLVTERCLQIHSDGQIYGWRAITPNTRIKTYKRKHPVKVNRWGHGAVGAMETLLDVHSELRIQFEKRILASPCGNKLGAVKRPCQAHWSWFLDQLRTLGYEVRREWPFNTENNGYQAVRRFINRVLDEHPSQAAKVIGGPDLEKKMISGDGVDRPVNKPFQRVEMDAHKIDGRFCVMLPQMTGGYLPKIIHRIWVLVIIEVFTRVVLGYHLSFRKEISKEDVLKAIKKSLTVWHPRKLMFSDNAYVDGAGFPSVISDQFVGICWDETSIDGALAEKAIPVREALKDVVGSVLITPGKGFSSRRSMNDRPFIENFFRHLGKNGFQRLSNTTGGKASDKQGRNPDDVALAGQFQIEYAEELLDVLIANYNATPHTTIGNRTPLRYLEFTASRSDKKFRYADATSAAAILCLRKKCKVNGGYLDGKRIFVSFMNAIYHGDILGQRYDLVGKYIWVTNHIVDDARLVQASTIDGRSLGVLRAAPPWNGLPHSVEVRSAIASCLRRRMFNVASMGDAVETFLEYVENQPDKKLPIHPAYLEARRVLVAGAEKEVGQSMIDHASETANKTKKVKSPNDVSASSKNDGLPKSPLPARRMAASKGSS